MQHLLLGCDAAGDCPLWIEGEGMGSAIPIPLSPRLTTDLLDWNTSMSAIVATPERYSHADLEALRTKLNEEGRDLARRVAEGRAGQATVRYLPE